MATDLNATSGLYRFFASDAGANDRESDRERAARKAIKIIRSTVGVGGSNDFSRRLSEVLIALRTANQTTVEATRTWINAMIAFSKLWRPAFEATSTLFPAVSTDAVVTYDANMEVCVLYATILGENIPGLMGLTPESIFSKDKLKLAQDEYAKPETKTALTKLKNGKALNNTDRQALGSLFKSVNESLSSLKREFRANSGESVDVNDLGVVSLDEQALVAMLTQSNNAHTRTQDRYYEQVQRMFDPSRFM